MDKNTFFPISNTHISVNSDFSAVSDSAGTFSIFVHNNDTVFFKQLGYKSVTWHVSDTLKGNEFVTGIYMSADTVNIGEVIIIPRNNNLRYEIMNSPSKVPATMENARYNVANAAYQGKTTTGKLGDPASNYGLIRQQQRVYAQERGGIPSSQIAGFNPLMILQAAYLLMHGLPEKPDAMEKRISPEELEKIKRKYLELSGNK